jgi:hypothetical protein
MRFLRASIWAKRRVDSRLLYSIACEVAEKQAGITHDIDCNARSSCVHLRTPAPYAFAAKDQCLFHALALLKFLAHYNIIRRGS